MNTDVPCLNRLRTYVRELAKWTGAAMRQKIDTKTIELQFRGPPSGLISARLRLDKRTTFRKGISSFAMACAELRGFTARAVPQRIANELPIAL
jgi:hypothetical protein